MVVYKYLISRSDQRKVQKIDKQIDSQSDRETGIQEVSVPWQDNVMGLGTGGYNGQLICMRSRLASYSPTARELLLASDKLGLGVRVRWTPSPETVPRPDMVYLWYCRTYLYTEPA